MNKKQSSFHMGNEFNGYGTVRYLKGTQCETHPPVSQENVHLSTDFKNCILKVLGSLPIVINPADINPNLLPLLGSLASVNQVIVTKDQVTGNYVYKFNVTSNMALTDGSYLMTCQMENNQLPTAMGVPDQWVAYGEPQGAKWKYYKDGHYVVSDWVYIKKDKAWYYLGLDEFMVTGWKKIEKKWYYFISNLEAGVEKNGRMALGWLKDKGLWYYLKEKDSAGYMVTGWNKIHRKWYYFNMTGEVVTSKLITWKGKKYFLKSDGTMAANETIEVPNTKKTYKADKNGICTEVKNGVITIALKHSKSFVKIVDGADVYYGGDQAWFKWENDKDKTEIARQGGCGTVASANIVAYLARYNSKYKELYAYSDYTQANYKSHMEDMYEYVTPRHISSIPLGVWPIGMIESGVEAFAEARNIELNAVRSYTSFNRETITEYIKEGLEKDSPVAMLIGARKLKDITVTRFGGGAWKQDISMHWVTITELKIDEINDTIKVKVSTWGGWAELDLDEYLEERLYQGLIYFE